jgi:surface antigen Omp85-like protein
MLVMACVMLAASTTFAQDADSRAEELRRKREQKATALEPYKPGTAERLLLWLENGRSWERLLNPAEGIYPRIGTITPGGGLSFGAGYRKPGLLNDRGAFSLTALGSLKGYWLLDAHLALPELAGGRVFAEVSARTYDYQSEAFYGPGPASRRDAESFFGFRNTTTGGVVGVRFGPHVSVGGGVEYLMPVVDRGRKATALQDRFTVNDAPGVDRQPDFGRYLAFAEVNTREPRANPRAGGLYAIRYERFDDVDLNAYNFSRVRAEVQQYLSLFNQRRVIALRALVSSASPDEGEQAPFYLQHTLGGPDDLRGFRRNRFRDNHLLLLQAEYRWEVFPAMDAALFTDWGKVASRREDLNFDDLEHDYGFGVRFGTINGVFLRIEGAFGSRDGKHFVFRFGDVF